MTSPGASPGRRASGKPGWYQVIVGAMREAVTDRVSLAAAGCGFYATMALFPAISVLISVYGLAFNVQSVEQQLALLRELLPPPAFALISERVHELVNQPNDTLSISLLISLVVAFWSASAGTKSVLSALNVAFDTVERRGIVGFQLTALAMTLCAVAAAVLAIAVLVFLPTVIWFIGLSDYSAALINIFSMVLLVVLVGGSIALLYRYGPSRERLRERQIFPGAILATLLWLIASEGLSLLRRAHRAVQRDLWPARRSRRYHAVVLPDRLRRASRRGGEFATGTSKRGARGPFGWQMKRPAVT